MKFCTFTLIDNSPDPITGVRPSIAERFQAVVRQAQWAEVLGLPDERGRESVERVVGDVVPVPRAAHPSRVWAS